MSMGIENVPATFQRLMDIALKGMHGTKVFVYLDDIVVYAESPKEHDNPGHIIRQFLRLSGYYRKFIRDYAKLAKPLFDLLKKEVKWEWGSSQRRSFRKLRRYLCNKPILLYPDFQQTFKLTTDASEYAVGAILSQDKDGVDMPVA